MSVLAFDIGGTKISYAVVENGKIVSGITKKSTPKDVDALCEIIKKAVKQNSSVKKVAIATAGVVFNNKVLFKPNNLPAGYEKIDFAELIGKPFVIENDANSSVWAEYKTGVLKGTRNSVILTLGTGVGCGIICDGKLLYGKTGASGEVLYKADGPSLIKLAEKRGIAETDCFEIAKLAKTDKKAKSALSAWQNNLLKAIVDLNAILDTEKVALGGSLADIVDYDYINRKIKKLHPHNPVEAVHGMSDGNSGIIGAALLAEENSND